MFDLGSLSGFLPIILIVFILIKAILIVKEKTSVAIERFGKYNRIAQSGINFIIPFVEKSAGLINLRVQQLDVDVETKH